MLLRDAQEEARVVYAARRGSGEAADEPLEPHLGEATMFLDTLRRTERSQWNELGEPGRAVGLLLLVALGLASELEIDSLEALRSVLLAESP